jgi:hypothetical protein
LDVCLNIEQDHWKQTTRHRWKQIKEAFRMAILDQIEEVKKQHFMEQKMQLCPFTQELYTYETCHVDHGLTDDKLSFEKILDLFLSQQALQAELKEPFQLVPRGSSKAPARLSEYGRKQLFIRRIELRGPPFELVDEKLREAWQDYHQGVAKLRVVSRRANLFLGKSCKKKKLVTDSHASSQSDAVAN